MGREEELLGTSMRKKLVFWLKGLVLFGFCVVSIFLLGAGFNNTSYAYAEEGAIDSGPFSEADANAHPVNGWDSKKNIITKMVNRSVPKKYTMLKIRIGIG